MTISLVIAMLATLAGVGLLRRAWRLGSRRPGSASHLVARWTGWMLIAAAIPAWSIGLGADRGVAIGALTAMLGGLALVLQAGFSDRRPQRNGRRDASAANKVDAPGSNNAAGTGNSVMRRVWIFVLAGPVSGAATLALALLLWLLLERAGVHAANVLTAVVLFVPLAWALLACIATLDVRLKVRTATVAVPLLAGALGSVLLAGVAA